jgi:SAM-dependent methyltransferase
MDPQHLHELATLEDSYWWHMGKRQLVLSLLQQHFPAPKKVVEGGTGGCGNLLAFRESGYEVVGLDLMPESAEWGRSRGLDSVYCHDLSLPWPEAARNSDVAVMLDVLEHVPDPALVLRNAAESLSTSGGLVVTVPAYPWLFGPWDRQLGHFRRYTPQRLCEDAQQAGLQVQWLSYWNIFSLPAAIAVRAWQRRQDFDAFDPERHPQFPRISPATNRLLIRLAAWERRWLKRARLPAGLSLVGVLMK